jgi:hypothetical protein
MKTSDVIIVHPDSEDKFEALKAFMKALKIKFEITTNHTILSLSLRLKKSNKNLKKVNSLV